MGLVGRACVDVGLNTFDGAAGDLRLRGRLDLGRGVARQQDLGLAVGLMAAERRVALPGGAPGGAPYWAWGLGAAVLVVGVVDEAALAIAAPAIAAAPTAANVVSLARCEDIGGDSFRSGGTGGPRSCAVGM